MASTGYVNGSDFGIFVGGSLISAAIDNQMQFTRNMIAHSNKDSDDIEYTPGKGDGTVSGSARFKYDAGYGFEDLFTVYKNATKVTIKYGNDTNGDKFYQFDAYISDLSRTDPDDDSSTISYTFQKTGAITEGTQSA